MATDDKDIKHVDVQEKQEKSAALSAHRRNNQ